MTPNSGIGSLAGAVAAAESVPQARPKTFSLFRQSVLRHNLLLRCRCSGGRSGSALRDRFNVRRVHVPAEFPIAADVRVSNEQNCLLGRSQRGIGRC